MPVAVSTTLHGLVAAAIVIAASLSADATTPPPMPQASFHQVAFFLSVQEEVSEVPGVRAVEVDLQGGRLTVTGDDVSEELVRAAVAEAGYEVV